MHGSAVPRQWATHGGEDVPVYAQVEAHGPGYHICARECFVLTVLIVHQCTVVDLAHRNTVFPNAMSNPTRRLFLELTKLYKHKNVSNYNDMFIMYLFQSKHVEFSNCLPRVT